MRYQFFIKQKNIEEIFDGKIENMHSISLPDDFLKFAILCNI